MFAHKVVTLENLPLLRQVLRQQKIKVVVTNGCFDIIHYGHAVHLEELRRFGDALLIGVNSDDGVRTLKEKRDPKRPYVPQEQRALMLAALESVSYVCVFPGARAEAFLAAASPDVYVKGGDYSYETLHPGERAVLDKTGCEFKFLPLLADLSTSQLIQKIAAAS